MGNPAAPVITSLFIADWESKFIFDKNVNLFVNDIIIKNTDDTFYL